MIIINECVHFTVHTCRKNTNMIALYECGMTVLFCVISSGVYSGEKDHFYVNLEDEVARGSIILNKVSCCPLCHCNQCVYCSHKPLSVSSSRLQLSQTPGPQRMSLSTHLFLFFPVHTTLSQHCHNLVTSSNILFLSTQPVEPVLCFLFFAWPSPSDVIVSVIYI